VTCRVRDTGVLDAGQRAGVVDREQMISTARPTTLSRGTKPSERRESEEFGRLSPRKNSRALGHDHGSVVGRVLEDHVGLVERHAVDERPPLDEDLVAGQADDALDEVAGAGRDDAEELPDAAHHVTDRAGRVRTVVVSPSNTTISPRCGSRKR
jgi:hypothetical protein